MFLSPIREMYPNINKYPRHNCSDNDPSQFRKVRKCYDHLRPLKKAGVWSLFVNSWSNWLNIIAQLKLVERIIIDIFI